ncbi:MAG: nitroreductase family protein [Thermoplasmata archaeon]
MEFSELIRKRRSVRAFKNMDVNDKTIQEILNDVNEAPSAGNLQSFFIFIIKDEKIKMKISEAAYGQEFIYQAPVVFIFCADKKRSSYKYGKRGENLYSIQDATIAATFAMLSIENHGLSSVWVGAFDEIKVSKIINVSENMVPVAIIPFGYPGEQPEHPGRRKIEEITKFF